MCKGFIKSKAAISPVLFLELYGETKVDLNKKEIAAMKWC